MRKRPAISERYPRMPKPPRTKTPSAVLWGVYEVTPEGSTLSAALGATARTPSMRLRALGYPLLSENRLTAAGWTIGKLRAFVEED
jgi:hypothetical protein